MNRAPLRRTPLIRLAMCLFLAASAEQVGTSIAQAETSPEEACFHSKLTASRYSATQIGACEVPYAKGGTRADLDLCIAKVAAATALRVNAADTLARKEGFECPGSLSALALDGANGWQPRLVESAIFATNPLPGTCVQKRAAAQATYAAKVADCSKSDFAPDPALLASCVAAPLSAFKLAWKNAASPLCLTADFASVSEATDAAIGAQARLVRIRCGDGVTGGLEQCDDGNRIDHDGCETVCTWTRFCGDGVSQSSHSEECDDGNLVSGDGCDANCILEACGNGIVQSGEICDDAGESEVCNVDCTPADCSDGIVNSTAFEECDDGNTVADDGCDGNCLAEFCGDNWRQASEDCDDGNQASGDGCSSGCRREECGRVGPAVACRFCPEGSHPDSTFSICKCDPGYTKAGSKCLDIDECALHTDRCGPSTPCVNVPGSWSCSIPCTATAFQTALNNCGAPSGVITFDCTDTTIAIPDFDGKARANACDGLTIDGLDRNIAFEMTPKCFGRPSAASACNVPLNADGTCDCPNVNSGTYFLSLNGDDMTVRNLTVRYFFDGIKVTGNDNTVENVVFDHDCDESMGVVGGTGNLFTGVWVKTACGKGMQNYADIGATADEPLLRDHYNAIVRDSLFTDCQQPIRMTDGGRYLIEGTRMEGLQRSGLYRCLGPRFDGGGGDAQVVHIVDSELEGCDNGIRIGGTVQAVVRRSTIVNNKLRGLLAYRSARVSMWDNIVRGNGGLTSGEPGLGGVAAAESARIDLGGDSLVIDGEAVSSPGGNTLCGNVAPGGSPREVHNLTAADVQARNNWWCSTAPLSRVKGRVATDPFLLRAR